MLSERHPLLKRFSHWTVKIIHTMEMRQHPFLDTTALIQWVHVQRYHRARNKGFMRAQWHKFYFSLIPTTYQWPMLNTWDSIVPKEITNFLIAEWRSWTSTILKGHLSPLEYITILYMNFLYICQYYHPWTYRNSLLIIIELHNTLELILQQKVHQWVYNHEIHLYCNDQRKLTS